MTVPADAACSWCKTPRARANKLIEGPGALICDECIRVAMGLVYADASYPDALDIVFAVVRGYLDNLPLTAPFATTTALIRAAVAVARSDAGKCRALAARVGKNAAAALIAYDAIPEERLTTTDMLNRSAMASEAGEHERARTSLAQLEDEDIGDAFRKALRQESLAAIMLCALRAGEHSEAARLAREHRAAYPSDVESLVVLALACERLGKPSDAARAWDQVRAEAHPDGAYARRIPAPSGGPFR